MGIFCWFDPFPDKTERREQMDETQNTLRFRFRTDLKKRGSFPFLKKVLLSKLNSQMRKSQSQFFILKETEFIYLKQEYLLVGVINPLMKGRIKAIKNQG
uniref:Uncharacterized protein n=1 Tax=Micrurus spixii TaxID=129469 RepID=A0A2D4M8A8_9SAUR